MLRVYNQSAPESEINGWEVFNRSKPNSKNQKNYSIGLSGTDRGIYLAIDRKNYEKLTIVDAGRVFPNINQITKLYSIDVGEGLYLPVVTAADKQEEDRNILLFNFETNPGEVITSLEFINMQAITSFITNKDYKSRVTLAAIDLDNTKDFGVRIKYGFNNGKKLKVEEIKFFSYNTIIENKASKSSMEFFTIDTSYEDSPDKISVTKLEIPRMDLSKLCVNKK